MSLGAADLARLWRTVRWLRAEQLLGRARLHLPRPGPDTQPAPPRRPIVGPWVTAARRTPSLVGATRLRFLGVERDVQADGWDAPHVALLWRYNLHYFDDLNADCADSRREWQRALLQRWIDENPPRAGTAWAPYPTSLRVVNWIKWFVTDDVAHTAWNHSLAVQARWLSRRLEWHLLGNHLFANAKALVFAGLCFDGKEAAAWLNGGVRIIERELPEQVLPDGGHFERSPMYHALALEDVLDLLNASAAWGTPTDAVRRLQPRLRDAARRMLAWLRRMQHPDGTLARFNDCAEGIAPLAAELERYAADLHITSSAATTPGVEVLRDSGYVRVQCGSATAFLDAAPIGPDYLPGHAHADTLSFELSIGTRQLVVNRGTSEYGTGPRRQYERGTAAHSTVQVGSHDSSEVWAGFRVGRRARPGPLEVDGWTIEGSHDGYAHLAGAPRHRRRWRFAPGGVTVEDTVAPSPYEPTIARFHLAPGLGLVPGGTGAWHIVDADGPLARLDVEAGRGQPATTLHALQFGRLTEAATLEVSLHEGRSAVRISWGSSCTSSS